MQLLILESRPESLRAGYECPCGCRPSVAYAHRAGAAHDTCCCGNEFWVGPSGEIGSTGRAGFERSTESFVAPWGEDLEATWLVGPSIHGEDTMHDHEAHHHELPMAHGGHAGASTDSALDPVCGMTVDRETQRSKGLVSTYEGHEYFFCGRGCKLDFDEDPARYLDPLYRPAM
jgi:YHS domain-containing protein